MLTALLKIEVPHTSTLQTSTMHGWGRQGLGMDLPSNANTAKASHRAWAKSCHSSVIWSQIVKITEHRTVCITRIKGISSPCCYLFASLKVNPHTGYNPARALQYFPGVFIQFLAQEHLPGAPALLPVPHKTSFSCTEHSKHDLHKTLTV